MQTRLVRPSSPLAVRSAPPTPDRAELPPQIRQTIGDTVRAGQVARRLGVAPEQVDHLRHAGWLIALPGDHGFTYPTWQFEGRGLLSGLPTVLQSLRASDVGAQLTFLVTPHSGLDGLSPLDALRAGRLDTVLGLARAFGGTLAKERRGVQPVGDEAD